MERFQSVFDVLKAETRGFVDRIYSGACASASVSLCVGEKDTQASLSLPDCAVWASQAIFQCLQPLAKCLVLRVLYVGDRFQLRDLRTLAAQETAFREAVRELQSLWILVESEGESESDDMDCAQEVVFLSSSSPVTTSEDAYAHEDARYYTLHVHFRAALQRALACPRQPYVDTHASLLLIDREPPSAAQLEQHCRSAWNDVLGYLVKLVPAKRFINTSVDEFVRQTGLLTKIRSEDTHCLEDMITSQGYEYMLKDYPQQVWAYLQFVLLGGSISDHSERAAHREQALSLVFSLSYTSVGQPCPVAALTETQKRVVRQLAEAGIVYMRSPSAQLFYPTHTAVNMLFGSRGLAEISSAAAAKTALVPSSAEMESTGAARPVAALQMIVETNLQVLAYVSSDLHLALMELFVEVSVRMPDMAFGRLQRNKVKDAYRAGITAAQIIAFLEHHAHPVVRRRSNGSSLPENVSDQLVLWEKELQRVHAQPGVFFNLHGVLRSQAFEELVQSLQRRQQLLWHNTNFQLVVAPDAEELVRQYCR